MIYTDLEIPGLSLIVRKAFGKDTFSTASKNLVTLEVTVRDLQTKELLSPFEIPELEGILDWEELGWNIGGKYGMFLTPDQVSLVTETLESLSAFFTILEGDFKALQQIPDSILNKGFQGKSFLQIAQENDLQNIYDYLKARGI